MPDRCQTVPDRSQTDPGGLPDGAQTGSQIAPRRVFKQIPRSSQTIPTRFLNGSETGLRRTSLKCRSQTGVRRRLTCFQTVLADRSKTGPKLRQSAAFGVFISPGGGFWLKTKDRRQKTEDKISLLSAQTARKKAPPPANPVVRKPELTT